MSKNKNNNELLLDLRGELYNVKNIVNVKMKLDF